MKVLQESSRESLKSLVKQQEGSLVSLLQEIQDIYGYLPEDVLREVARGRNIPLIDVYSVATFYKAFSLKPKGKNRITACTGTACHVRGSQKVTEEISRSLGVQPGDTTADGLYSLETVSCLGACALAPLVLVNGESHGNMTPARAAGLLDLLRPGAGDSSPAKTGRPVKERG
jgi:NADH:ubiquinone oxidoreductase subunit E